MSGMYVEMGKGNTYESIGQFLATETTTRMVLVIILLVID